MLYFYSCMSLKTRELHVCGTLNASSKIRTSKQFDKISEELIRNTVLPEFQKLLPDIQLSDITFIAFNRL